MHCAQALGTPILGDYKYGRKVHEEWLCEADEECEAVENNDVVNTKPNRRRNATLPDVKGSITSEKPFLHLHSRLIAIPKVKELNKKKEESKEKLCFVDNLRLFAPLPPHMKSSWILLPPTHATEK